MPPPLGWVAHSLTIQAQTPSRNDRAAVVASQGSSLIPWIMSTICQGLLVSFIDTDGARKQLLVDAQLPCTEKSALVQLLEHKGIDVPLVVQVSQLRRLAEQLALSEISWTTTDRSTP